MRSLRISAVILAVMILFIVCDIFYCRSVTDKLGKMLEKAETSGGCILPDVEEMINYWNKHEPFVHLGTNTEYTDRVTEALLSLRAAVTEEEAYETKSALALLKNYVSELRRMNGVNLENIF